MKAASTIQCISIEHYAAAMSSSDSSSSSGSILRLQQANGSPQIAATIAVAVAVDVQAAAGEHQITDSSGISSINSSACDSAVACWQ
jgi:hypothetical protein